MLGRRPAQGNERRVPDARQGERGVDLVGHHQDAVPLGQRRDPVEVRRAEHSPGRVVRAAEQVPARARREGRLERLEVNFPPAVRPDQRDLDDPPARASDVVEERRVHGGVDDHAIAGLGSEGEDQVHARHDVGDQVNQAGVHRPAVPGRGEPGERLADAAGVGVAAVVEVDRRAQRLLHRFGEVVVHLRDEGRQHVGREGAPLLAAPAPEPVQVQVLESVPHGESVGGRLSCTV